MEQLSLAGSATGLQIRNVTGNNGRLSGAAGKRQF